MVFEVKLWYSRSSKARSGVDILAHKESVDFVLEVRHKGDRIMATKVVVGIDFLNVVSVYAPQSGLLEDIKKKLWEDLDTVIQDIPRSEKLFTGGDFNGPIGVEADEYDTVHRGFGYSEKQWRSVCSALCGYLQIIGGKLLF